MEIYKNSLTSHPKINNQKLNNLNCNIHNIKLYKVQLNNLNCNIHNIKLYKVQLNNLIKFKRYYQSVFNKKMIK